MPASIVRTVNGKDLDREAFVTLLCETIDELTQENPEGARVQDIVANWGDPAWQTLEARHTLNRELVKLFARKKPVVVRGERGYYRVATAFRIQGNSGHKAYWGPAVEAAIANGGFIEYSAIREIFGIAPRAPSRVDYDVRDPGFRKGRKRIPLADRFPDHDWGNESQDLALREALKRCDDLAHHFPDRGLWNLVDHRLNAIPLEARWARLLFYYGTEALSRPAKHDKLTQGRHQRANFNGWLRSVGGAYRDARITRGLEIEDLMKIESLQSAVMRVAQQHDDRQGYLDWCALPERPDDLGSRPKAFGRWTDRRDWAECVLDMFEDGHPPTHELALTHWHTTFADFYRLDPVALSRGLIIPPLTK